jgi:hypothetical protein
VRDRGNGSFIRRTSVNWDAGTTETIAAEQFLVRTLIATKHSAVLDALGGTYPGFPAGRCTADLAIPVITGHDLRAIALYGKHDGSGPVDPEERRLLERLAKAAATAYERIESAALRRRADLLERQAVRSHTLVPPT